MDSQISDKCLILWRLIRTRAQSSAGNRSADHPCRLVQERVEEAPSAQEPHSELLRFADRALLRDLRLARVAEVMTPAA